MEIREPFSLPPDDPEPIRGIVRGAIRVYDADTHSRQACRDRLVRLAGLADDPYWDIAQREMEVHPYVAVARVAHPFLPRAVRLPSGDGLRGLRVNGSAEGRTFPTRPIGLLMTRYRKGVIRLLSAVTDSALPPETPVDAIIRELQREAARMRWRLLAGIDPEDGRTERYLRDAHGFGETGYALSGGAMRLRLVWSPGRVAC